MGKPVSGKTYRFECVGASNKRLNLYSSGTASDGMNVVLYSPDNTNEQQWLYSGNRLYIKTNTAYCLDRFTGSSALDNADIYKATSADANEQLVTFEEVSGYSDRVKIRLTTKVGTAYYYLTAYNNANGTGTGKSKTSNGNVFWRTSITNDLQVWKFTEVTTGGGTTGSTPIAPPTSIESVNLMQRYNAPLSFTGTNVTIKNVQNDSSTEYYHRGSGFRPSESGSNFLNTANGQTVLTTIQNFVKTVYNTTTTPTRAQCAYYLFGEYDSSALYHHGVDINIGEGSAIRAFYGGKVVAKGGDYGRVQIYVPSLNVTTCYLHMKNIPSTFAVGDTIGENTIIGYQSNKSPYSISTHLHFEVRPGSNTYCGDNTTSASSKALTSIIPYGYMKK